MVEEIMKNKTDNYEAKEKITCKVDKIDNLFLEHETFDFLKVDAQGYDLEVLKGSLNILKNQKIKGVLVEFIEAKLYKNQFKLSSLLEFMDSVNYKLHSFPSLTHTSKGNLYYGDAFFISKEFAKEKNY